MNKQDLKTELEVLERHIEDLQHEIRVEQNQRTDVEHDMENLKQELCNEEENRKTASRRVAELEAMYSASQEQIDDLLREKAALEDRASKYKQLSEENERAINDGQRNMGTMDRRIRDLEARLGEKNTECVEIEKEVDKLRGLLAGKDRQMEEMNRSAKESSSIIRTNNRILYERISASLV